VAVGWSGDDEEERDVMCMCRFLGLPRLTCSGVDMLAVQFAYSHNYDFFDKTLRPDTDRFDRPDVRVVVGHVTDNALPL
jgi:inorganic pyrophosphatase